MSKSKEICSVDLGSSLLDDKYTLYEDGRLRRYYDRNQYSLNNEVWLEVETLSDRIKQKLLEQCPEELKEQGRQLLYQTQT